MSRTNGAIIKENSFLKIFFRTTGVSFTVPTIIEKFLRNQIAGDEIVLAIVLTLYCPTH